MAEGNPAIDQKHVRSGMRSINIHPTQSMPYLIITGRMASDSWVRGRYLEGSDPSVDETMQDPLVWIQAGASLFSRRVHLKQPKHSRREHD